MTDDDRTRTQPGHYYGDDGRRLHDLGTTNAGRPPDVVICRRVADCPAATPPPGSSVVPCATCGAAVVTNAAKYPTVPRTCMQCAHIRPEPL